MSEFLAKLGRLFLMWVVVVIGLGWLTGGASIALSQFFGLALIAIVPIAAYQTIAEQARRLTDAKNGATTEVPITRADDRIDETVALVEGAKKPSVDVNHEGESVLATLPTIGPIVAKRLVAERERGAFRDLEDLSNRCSLQPHQMVAIRDQVIFGARGRKKGFWTRMFGNREDSSGPAEPSERKVQKPPSKGRRVDY